MNILKPYFVWRPWQIALRIVREYHRPPAAVVSLPWGRKLKINPREAIGSAIWKTGVHELATTEAIFRLLPPGGIGVDVGANIGYMTAAMSACVGHSGRILAFEPHPLVFERLSENVRLLDERRDAPKIEIFRLALSDAEGTANLVSSQTSGNQGMAHIAEPGDDGENCQVNTRTLSKLWGTERISVLKLDVEGHELRVLRGAERLLTDRLIDHIIFEDHEGPQSPVQKWLSGFGYTILRLTWEVAGPSLRPASDPGSHVTFQAQDFLATLRPTDVTSSFKEKGWLCFSPR